MGKNDREFFNSLAENWDTTRAHDPVRLAELVARTGIQPGQAVLDVGCGTGVLIPFLLQAAGPSGTVTGIDIADNMVKIAADKFAADSRVVLARADVMEYVPERQVEHVTCLNFFPHIQDKQAFLHKAISEWLDSGGWLHIFHDLSRERVNRIHGGSKEVGEDRLPPSGVVGNLLSKAGFVAVECYEDEGCFFVQGRKPRD